MIEILPVSGTAAHNTTKSVTKVETVTLGTTALKEPVTAISGSDKSTLSTLARQLSESAARAQSRDQTLSFKELGALAAGIIDRVVGTGYYAYRELHDAEVPDTTDSELLERAKQATEFSYGRAKNPFQGLSQDQLSLIIYDEQGDYTINERNAAFSEDYAQDQAWNSIVIKRLEDEDNETGKSTKTLYMILAHYNDLPPIKQARQAEGYKAIHLAVGSPALSSYNSPSQKTPPFGDGR
ncbi:hypothetical protein [Pseudomonas viridiflava]|uniref:hypothetical protein n=1 Tax=Pseudomonas viridiflava TaxID=33069 RepID=UPI0010FAB9D2|nr:hypothetical protein [Pseudomonas viridiflava]